MSALMTGIRIIKGQRQKVKPILPFEPLPWQIGPWRDTSPVLLLTGSAGGGKSQVAAEKINAFCKKYPNAMALMLRKTRESMTNSTVLFMARSIIGTDPQVRHYPSFHRFEYANSSILAYGGMKDEEQREQIRSIGQGGKVDFVWMEEANKFTEDDFNEVRARMRGTAAPWCQVLLTTNPDAPIHWINRRLIIGGEAKVYYSGAQDNPHNPKEYLDALDSLTGLVAKRLREGQWVQAEGVVYEEYDPALHLIEPREIPKSWRRIRVIDFGFTNPLVCQWWAIDNDGRMYRYREIYRTKRLVEDHAVDILRLSEGETIETTICDHDAEDRATLERRGIPTVPAIKAVSTGIQDVQARLRKAGDGKPRLFLLRGALVETDPSLKQSGKPTCTEEEFPTYIWPEGKDGRPLKEQPIKENDHGMDALRYAVESEDGIPPEKPFQVA